MRAMVLCAGLGTRLRPLTARWPKPALPLLGQPLLRYTLATLVRAGVRELAVNTYHLPELMEDVARAECARAGVSLVVSRERGELLGTGGGIRALRSFLEAGGTRAPFLVVNGDVLFGVDLGRIVEEHRRRAPLASMVCLPMPAGGGYNAVEADADGRVRRIAGRGPTSAAAGDADQALVSWHFTGVHVLSPEVFQHMASSGAEDINHDVYPRALAAGREVRVVALDAGSAPWFDLGTPARFASAHGELLRGEIPLEPFAGGSPFEAVASRRPGVWIHPSARVDVDRVTLVAPVWLGEGCEIGAGASLGPEVSIGPLARVGAGACLRRSAVLDGATVEAGAEVDEALVAPDGVRVATSVGLAR